MKYQVTVPFAIYVTLEVEVDGIEDAKIEAVQEVYLTNYCGNGGHDRLVGVSGGSIEVGDDTIAGIGPFEIFAEEL